MYFACMATLRPTQHSTDWREGRRLRAWELRQHGWTQQAIATALGITQGAVSQWLSRAQEGGIDALRRRPAPGAPPRLPAAQRAQIPALLHRGPEAWGFRGALWTRPRVAEVLRRTFGVSYHPSHVGRLLTALRWSPQKPRTRATQRDEAAIQHWRDARWPVIKKKR